MRIIADENIPYAAEAFSLLGEVSTCAGRDLTPERVRGADALLVRSVTKVDAALLAGSGVKFVATATIGFDHVDRAYLDSAGIAFASAPGSNANSVAEWVTAALLRLAVSRGESLRGKTLGVIGVGNVGSRVALKAAALGMRVLKNDPPRARREGNGDFAPLGELLAGSDFVTVHVPLNREGEDKTLGLAGEEFFHRLKPGAAFLNSSRGGVVVEPELKEALASQRVAAAMLDVWRNEPEIDRELLGACFLGTPHIAGYSFDGKVAGTRMIYDAAREFFGLGAAWDPEPLLPRPEVPDLSFDAGGLEETAALERAVSAVYPIASDDGNLRAILGLDPAAAGKHFTKLRKDYPRRREFRHTRLALRRAPQLVLETLAGLGFTS